MCERKFWFGSDCLLEETSRNGKLVSAEFAEAERVEASSFRVTGNTGLDKKFVRFRSLTNAQTAPEFSANARDDAEEVFCCANLGDFADDLAGATILQAHIDPQLTVFGLADGSVGAENDEVAPQRGTNARCGCAIECIHPSPRRVGSQICNVLCGYEPKLLATGELGAQHLRQCGT